MSDPHPDGGFVVRQRYPFRCRFEPQADITAYELALILPFLLKFNGWSCTQIKEEWIALGDARRHLPEENEHK